MDIKVEKSELFIRLISSIVMIIIGFLVLYVGGKLFEISIILVSSILAWEILGFNKLKPYIRICSSFVFAISLGLFIWFSPLLSIFVFSIFLLLYKFIINQNNYVQRATYFIIIFFSLSTLSFIRIEIGIIQTLWVMGCVVSSDIGGYFVGRNIGGPKLWYTVSPKKTWSGVVGGWLLAILTTYIFYLYFEIIEFKLLFLSIPIALFSQIGDLFESFLKRNAKIKDSSNLIPGHGGFLDRFDGMIGAFFAIYIVHFFLGYNWIF